MKSLIIFLSVLSFSSTLVWSFDTQEPSEEEVTHLQTEVRDHQGDPISHYNLGHAYHELGRTKEAISEYQAALRIDPNFAEAHNNLGTVYFELGENKEAIGEYQKALNLLPDYPEAHMGLGVAYYLNRDTLQAVPHLQQAEKLFDQENEEEKRRQANRILTIIRIRARLGNQNL